MNRLFRILRSVLTVMLLGIQWQGMAQLTVTSTGQTGTFGTNWNISGNVLTVSGGAASIAPSVITNHLATNSGLTVVVPFGGSSAIDISINSSIVVTAFASRTLTFKSRNDITIASGVSVTGNNAALNLVLRAANATAGPDYGRVFLDGSTISTNGGHLWVGGGTTNTTWNGLEVGTEAARTWTQNTNAISMRGSTQTTINTAGGNLYMAGMSYVTDGTAGTSNYGIFMDKCSISTAGGQVDMNGSLLGTYSNGAGLRIEGVNGDASITTTSGSLNLTGTGTDASANANWRHALCLYTGTSYKVSLSTTTGNINVTGSATFTNGGGEAEGIFLGASVADGLRIISRSGNISLLGSNSSETSQGRNAIRFSAGNVSNALRIGYDGTNAYSGNITVQGNALYQAANNAGTGSISMQSTGTLTIQPKDGAFSYLRAGASGTLTFDDDWNFGTTLSGFTFGKAGNTQDLSYQNELTVAGPITFHVNSFTINNNITSSTASDITINANVNFSTNNSRDIISTSNGNIIIHADKDANGTGQLDLDYLTLNPGSGNITIRGETFNWTTTNSTDKPYINGTGSFTIEPGDAVFGQGLQTLWFVIDQDANGISGVTLGKSGNTADIVLNHAGGMTVAGSVNVYGGIITVSTALTSSANGDIFLKSISSSNNCIINNSTITKSGGTGTLTFQGHARVNNSGTITTSGSGVLNVVMWSDFDNSNNDGGVSPVGAISTNGGHVWIGGSNSSGGSYTWNGLTVGDGPSVGTAGFNANPIDIGSAITTSGGEFLAWAGSYITVASGSVNAGAGSITIIADNTYNAFPLTTTGTLTLAPDNGAYSSALSVGGTLGSGNLSLNTGHYSGLQINSVANLAGLTIGRYSGMLTTGATPAAVVQSNSSDITIASAISITGPVSLYGNAIALNASLTTTSGTTGNMTISGTTVSGSGNLVVAGGRTATITVTSASTYAGVVSGTGSGLTKSGAGTLTLSGDNLYTGATTISAGDLQVGSGGSVSQASSGSLASASAVSVASGCKLILSPNENMTFGNAVSGAGGLEMKGMSGRYYNAFLTGTATTMVTSSTVLEVLTRITGGLQSGLSVVPTLVAGVYRKSYAASTNTATLQFQQYDGTLTKVVFATLSQSGSDVQILATGAAYRNGNTLGVDMSSGSTNFALATSSGANGYGIAEVYMSGKVNFTGSLTYTGATTLSNTVTSVTSPNTYSYTSRGTQEITNASASFPSGSAVANNGLIILNRSTALTISNDLSGTEEIIQVGADITFTGTNTYSGATTIDVGNALNIGDGGAAGSLSGDIANYGSLTFNRSNASTYAGVVSGTGTLTKSGAGALTMTGLNTYTGATTISAGSLVLERNVPATSSSGFSGAGTLVIQPSSTSFTSQVNYPISGFSVSSSIGGLTIGKSGNTQTINFNGATTVGGPLTVYGTVTIGANITTTNSGDLNIYSDASLTVSGTRTATVAGLFKYMPDGTSFSNTVSFPFSNTVTIPNYSLTVNSNGMQLGKSGNTAAITIAAATSSSGPVTVYSGAFTVNTGASLTATASALEVNASGNVSLNGALDGSSTTINGQGNVKTFGSITNLNLTGGSTQSISGTATLTNLTLNKSAGTATVGSGPQNLTGVLTLTAGTLAAGGNLTLKSTATGTARVAEHSTGTGNVTGNVNVERYLAGTAKHWRTLGFPYSNNMALSAITGMSIDYSASSRSVMQYNESADNGIYSGGGTSGRNAGYASFTADTETLPAGKGVMAWVYGNAGGNANSSGPLSSNLTVSSSGSLNENGADVSLPVFYTSANTNKGWNLVSNPFAASIDWNSANIVKTNIDATMYRWDPAAASWTSYNSTTATGSPLIVDGIIESGSAFFVKASAASPVLTVKQSAKTTTGTAMVHFGRVPQLDVRGERAQTPIRLAGIRVSVQGQGNPHPDEVYVDVSRSDATEGFDGKYDAYSMGRTSGAGLAVKDARGGTYAMQFDRPIAEPGVEKRYYPMRVTSPSVGETTLELWTTGSWNPLNSVSLIDNQTGRTILLRGGRTSYAFRMEALREEGRFVLAINHVKVDGATGLPASEMKLQGNPVQGDVLDLMLTHPTAQPRQWSVVDMTGRTVASGRFGNGASDVQHRLPVPGLRTTGHYVLQVEMDNGERTQLRFLKQ